MNLQRLPSNYLPSIRVFDQNSMDTGSDQPNSQRSLPREIPKPKHGSPSSSKCGSMHGSIVSPGIPPILSLEPPGACLPPPNYQAYRHGEYPSPVGKEEFGSEGLRPRKVVLDVRHRTTLSPIGLHDESELSGSSSRDGFSVKSEDSFDRNWRERFYQKADERASPKELQSEESLRAQIRQSVDAYDSSLVRKLNASTSDTVSFTRPRLTPPREFRPFPAGFSDAGHQAHWRANGSPRHIASSSATVSPKPIDSPLERWRFYSGADSLPTPPFTSEHSPPALEGFPGNIDSANLSSSHVTDPEFRSNGRDSCIRRSASASLLGNGCDSFNEEEDSQMEDASSSHVSKLRLLTLQDARSTPHLYQRVGSKRRASSPPGDDVNTCSLGSTRKGLLLKLGGTDFHQKYYNQPPPRSASGSITSASASSGTTLWSGSTSAGQYSSASSMTAADWASSPGGYPPTSPDIDNSNDTLSFPPCSSKRSGMRQREIAEISTSHTEKDVTAAKRSPASTRNSTASVKNNSALKMAGMYICECCPKKPKKFDSQAELQLHAMEKQYSCQYCNNRFKNKNEAERHQNSLHLRKHSWSCAQLVGNYEAAFHQSPHSPNFADICGYCGKEFSVPAQWNVRVEHLTAEHKFGECNQSKKFFRADHFRQHLKHSHSGTSGKWTNVLENACMREEIPPTPHNRGGTSPDVISEETSE